MDVREKLVELLLDVKEKCDNTNCGKCDYLGKAHCTNAWRADHLIANGVTVQDSKLVEIDQFNKWISVKEHLPQENEPVGATCEQVQVLLDNGVVSTGWCNRRTKLWWHLNYGETRFIGFDYEHTPVIAWQPLAQPPKGE